MKFRFLLEMWKWKSGGEECGFYKLRFFYFQLCYSEPRVFQVSIMRKSE